MLEISVMDSSVFSDKAKTRNRDDRFVLPREYIREMRRRSWHAGDSDTQNVNCSINEKLKRKKYADHLEKSLGIYRTPCTQLDDLWPCRPRKKTYLSPAHSILDLPTYSDSVFPELLDWSKDNVLVAALGSNYHKLNWSSQSMPASQVYTRNDITCCKFDPTGELILLGTHLRGVEIHSNALNKCVRATHCTCERRTVPYRFTRPQEYVCSVTAADWSPTGNSFVIGCSLGAVMSFSRSAEVISRRRVGDVDAVSAARVAPDTRFVAIATLNSAAVFLLTWPTLEQFATMKSHYIIKTIAWHPWRSALLGVGVLDPNDSCQARVAVWNARKGEVRDRVAPRPYCLDAMLFSERTGELVASLCSVNFETGEFGSKPSSQLVVLGSPESVVDTWGEGAWPDRVRTMVFNPDETKLAAATSGEDLIIWNFLPEDKMQKKRRLGRFVSMPLWLDNTTQGYSVR